MSESKIESKIEFIIDTRERELLNKLQDMNPKVEQMEIGDILFRRGEEIFLIIERKTITDLKASICDGRNREQKARLMSNVSKNRIIYLIEGDFDKSLESKVSGFPFSTLLGSLINTQLRDGIKVYKTASLEESSNFLRKLFEKVQNDSENYFKDEEYKISAGEYSSKLKKGKKENMTPQVWFISQLSMIPRVTEKIASVISEKYPTVKDLMIEYERTPLHLREKLLSDLPIVLETLKTRRIGDKISSRIYKYFYGIIDEELPESL